MKSKMKNIVLIGMAGSGKTSSGEALAKMSGRRFVDIDRLIVEQTGMPIAKYFEKYGEESFRNLESDAIQSFAGTEGYIISTGGGAVLNPDNLEFLKANGIIFYLKASVDMLLYRLQKTSDRPLLAGDMKANLERIYAERKELYQSFADYTIDTDNLTPEQTAQKIIDVID